MGGQAGLGCYSVRSRGQVVLGSPGSWVGETDLIPKSLLSSSQIISQIWPYLSMIMENKFREKLEPKIREKSSHLRTFTFTKLYFGQKVGNVSGGAACLYFADPASGHAPDREYPRGPPQGPGPHLHFSASQPQWRPLTPESQHRHLCRFKGSLAQRQQKGKVGNKSAFLKPNFENMPCCRSQPERGM